MSNAAVIDALKAALPPKSWSEDPGEIAPHLTDWRGRERGETPILLKPASTEEVAKAVGVCAAHGAAILPQGGNTGLVAGSTPKGEILLSLKRMNAIRAIDPLNDSLVAEAGVILETVQGAAAGANRLFPLSLGSQGSATIGGLISTNAGGVHVLRYGMMRDLVLGIEAVLPDGSVWNGLTALRKDNTGYDLKQLFIGAEGTLGVVAAAALKLFPRPASAAVAIAGLDSAGAAVELLALMKAETGGGVAAFELIPRSGLDMVLKHVPGARAPLAGSYPWHVLIEVTTGQADAAAPMLQAALEKGAEAGLIADAALAQNQAQAADFWKLRETIPEGEKAHGRAAKHDVSVPVSKMAEFIDRASAEVEAMLPEALIVAFGHVGDGNVHFNVSAKAPGAGEDFIRACEKATRHVYDLVGEYGGSISAEHGIGTLKRGELSARKPQDVTLMRAIKQALDPKNIMNPRMVL